MGKEVDCNKKSKTFADSCHVIGSLEESKCQSNILKQYLEVSTILFYSTSLSFLSQN